MGVQVTTEQFLTAVEESLAPGWVTKWGLYEEQLVNESTAFLSIRTNEISGVTGHSWGMQGEYTLQLVANISAYSDMLPLFEEFRDIMNGFAARMGYHGNAIPENINFYIDIPEIGDDSYEDNDKVLKGYVNWRHWYYESFVAPL